MFQCSTGKKLVAVCASRGWSKDSGHLQYRFGTPQRVELRIPGRADAMQPVSALVGLIVLAGGGGGATLRFKSGEHDYTVYSAISASIGEKAGVVVSARGKRIAALSCKAGSGSTDLDFDALEQGGLPRDHQSFVLP